jgi:hypothetical protein
LAVFSVVALQSFAIKAQEQLPEETPSAIGFECANEAMNVIPLLGRGDDFPAWLLKDIETELKRQASTSQLVQATCTAPPEILAAVLPKDENDPNQGDVLSQLRIEFYVDLIVNTGQSVIPLKIEQVYLANNLETMENRKVIQRFVVVKQPEAEPQN